MMHIIIYSLILLFGVIIIFYTIKIRDILNPVLLFLAPIVLNMLLFVTLYLPENPISIETLLVFTLGATSFIIGYFIIDFNFGYLKIIKTKNYYCDNGVKKVLLFIALVGILIGIFQLMHVGLYGPTQSFFTNVRIFEVFGKDKNHLVKYAPVILQVLVCTEVYEYFFYEQSRKKLIKLIVLSGLLLFTTLFTMARTAVLQYTFSIAYIFFYGKRKKNNNWKFFVNSLAKLVSILILLVIVFTIYANISGRSTESNIFNKDYFLYKYLGFSLVAFDKWVINNPGISKGYYVLGPFGYFLQNFKIVNMAEVTNALAPVTEFNVYSYLAGPYLDFGIMGVIIVMLILGIIISYMYRCAQKKAGYYMIFYSIYIYSIVISFFAYQFSNTYYIYILILIMILSRFRLESKRIKVF